MNATRSLFDLPTERSLMNRIRAQRDARERKFGHELDSMEVNELWRLCNYVFPSWPQVFGKHFTAETARTDPVLRRLLMFVLNDSNE